VIFVKKFFLVLILIFASCGNNSDEVTQAEYEYEGQSHLVEARVEEIIALQNRIAEFEARENLREAQHEIILQSFLENLEHAALFLGVNELNAHEAEIEITDGFVTARFPFDAASDVLLTYRYFHRSDEIHWVLLQYAVNWVGGYGFLDSGRSAWQWQQDEIFTESFTMRFYATEDINPDPIYVYFDEEITPHNWQRQVIDHMRTHTGIRLADLWLEESRLVADLTPAAAVPFNHGSTGGAVYLHRLITSLSTLPNVTEIEVLVGGQRGMWADHFNFAWVYVN
jgi:hypothetical protein